MDSLWLVVLLYNMYGQSMVGSIAIYNVWAVNGWQYCYVCMSIRMMSTVHTLFTSGARISICLQNREKKLKVNQTSKITVLAS